MANAMKVVIEFNRLPALRGLAPKEADRVVEACAREGERYVKMSFGTSPSAPGDPPGVDTGNLRNSITVQDLGLMKREIVDGTEYGIHLEFGTTNMEARPFMTPMIEWLRGEVKGIAEGFLE